MTGTIANLEGEKKQLESEMEAERQNNHKMQAALDAANAQTQLDHKSKQKFIGW